ncbi:MAG: polysaccharide pyruvyl transferase family protein [Phenylobacterium sp.]|uniref:polysaccharide pyruvyl transferase family protein n=1 Tax=Phenylobacterium sp. TaxID=1871053 RepID=UPI0017A8B92E|nr:polysaccharide pyruvyl transferase family protein [Phenylobacterium sp.]MBA4794629.1 polysaccharide pyruvyl transferase family protein [Phenylobacterium sp.]
MTSATLVPKPRVALVSGFWGQNIGNAFFNIGGKWILEQVFGAGNVAFIQDQPGYRTFHDQSKGNPDNDIELLRFLDVDYIVLQGPLLTTGYAKLWRPTFQALAARGTKILLIGAAFFKFRDEEYAAAKAFLEEFPPALISTRDTRSYEQIRSWGLKIPLFDGMDSAFFAPKAYTPFGFTAPPYVALNFDRYIEPTITIAASAKAGADFSFERNGKVWSLEIPALPSKLAHRSKVQAYLGHLLDRRKLPTEIDGLMVIRPEHRVNPHMTYKIYQHPNAVASDEPWTYFNIYANADLVLADRVHACVAALAYGREAMLFTPSPRQALFGRVGAHDIRTRPISIDLAWLEEERQKEVAWLRKHI